MTKEQQRNLAVYRTEGPIKTMKTITHPALIPGVSLAEQRIGLDRLKLAVEKNRAHDTGIEQFDFSVFYNRCGTLGCILGSFPHIWPKDWAMRIGLITNCPVLMETQREGWNQEGMTADWLSITECQVKGLFMPYYPEDGGAFAPQFPSATALMGGASLESVLRNIENFIAWKDQALTEAEQAAEAKP